MASRADVLGGGGCPLTDEVLIPELPFDFLQPPMKKQITQVGYGGPFVIRGNPIGALVDAIRGFCTPVPMQQVSSDGGVYSDLSGSGLGSYGDYTSAYPGGGNFGTGLGGISPYTNYGPNCVQCSSASVYDPVQMCCVPQSMLGAGTSTPSTTGGMTSTGMACDAADLAAVAVKAAACVNDKACLCNQAVYASNCAQIQGANSTLANSWSALATRINQKAGVNCNTYTAPAGTTPPTTGGGTTGSGSGTTPNTGTTAGTTPTGGTTGTGTTPMGGTTPIKNPNANTLDYISNAQARIRSRLGAIAGAIPTRTMPALPNPPNPMSLTEGNVRMVPTNEPLGGSFDPSRAISGRMAGRLSFSQRMMRSVRR
jgi:hypothetical protein